jgi:4-hydroxy-2-oxoheptanedioate aldolase
MSGGIGVNHTKRKLVANELVLAMAVNQMRTLNVAIIAAACRFNAIYNDVEHDPPPLETAAPGSASPCSVWDFHARVTSHDPHDATRIPDCGALGVMVPHIQNATEAREVVEACGYSLLGHRSAAGSLPSLGIPPCGNR